MYAFHLASARATQCIEPKTLFQPRLLAHFHIQMYVCIKFICKIPIDYNSVRERHIRNDIIHTYKCTWVYKLNVMFFVLTFLYGYLCDVRGYLVLDRTRSRSRIRLPCFESVFRRKFSSGQCFGLLRNMNVQILCISQVTCLCFQLLKIHHWALEPAIA